MKQSTILLLVSLIILHTGCRKMIELPAPPTQLTDDKIFSNEANLEAAINNLYASYKIADAGLQVNAALYADELFYNGTDAGLKQFHTGNLVRTNLSVANLWKNFYKVIYQSNLVIEGLADPGTNLATVIKNKANGEAKFIRACAYYHLLNLFGDIPLLLVSNVETTANTGRNSALAVYAQVTDDLVAAKLALPSSYPVPGKLRANKWSAAAMLSRVYLEQKQWQHAVDVSDEIILSGMYHLVELNNVFIKDNSEAIFQLWEPLGYTPFAPAFLSFSTFPAYSLRSGLLNSFESGDMRKLVWTRQVTYSGIEYVYPYKYKVTTSNTTTTAEYNMQLRLAEQYLIRAEASANLNDLAAATSDLNMIRVRAGKINITPASKEDVLTAIALERRCEYFCENTFRLYDLKRTGTMDEILLPLKPGWKPTAKLFPVPHAEILANPRLIQNPGY